MIRILKKSVLVFLAALIIFILIKSITSIPANMAGLDQSFLHRQPYKKGKQRVDLNAVTEEKDMRIIREAIDPIMRFFYGLGQTSFRPDVLLQCTTESGRKTLRYPPQDTEFNRYLFTKIWHWKVIEGKTIAVDAEFENLLGDRFYKDHYIFIKQGDTWKFDRHE